MSLWSMIARKLFPAPRKPAAFDSREADVRGHAMAPVRSAGTDAMRDPPRRWSKEDEESDASFPASNPPANY